MSKRRLLLADDSVTIQKVINLTFADEGMEVITVGDGDAAMRKFVESVPDLVMADVNMPGVDGYQICEMIKQDEETKNIPVILLVGSFEPFDEAEAQRVGADDYLIKPFQSIRQLVDKVSVLLNFRTDDEDFLSPIETADVPAAEFDNFAQTEAAQEFDSADISTENFGDAGMDDEMIQTAQLSSSPPKETEEAKVEIIEEFESEPILDAEPIYQSSEEIAPNSLVEQQDISRQNLTELDEDDWATTQPSSKKDFDEIKTTSSANKTTSVLNFDDLDLLEFPQLTPKAIADQVVLQPGSELFGKTPERGENTESEISDQSIENLTDTAPKGNLSPELIEAIADKVFEKISNEVIKTVVREVIAQMEQKE